MKQFATNPFGWQFEHSYLDLPSAFFSPMQLQPATKPELIVFNHALAINLGLEDHENQQIAWALMLSGSQMLPNARPTALAYAGHQFAHFTMLGDGRALWLGEHITPQKQRFDIQLKGSGPTPYARRGDGRAALGPMLREYLISEAMHGLGIPTTRSLAVVATGDIVQRDTKQLGAVLTRVAASHIRVGTFEYAASLADPLLLNALLDYTVQRHVSRELHELGSAVALLEHVKQTQVALICEWLRVGFIHGVMNTDNMALSGETIDYGPCAFMDQYHPSTVFSSIDQQGRYAFSNQPWIAQWNFARLVECVLPLIHDDEKRAIAIAEQQIIHFAELFQAQWLIMMREKLGIVNQEDNDLKLVHDLLSLMQQHEYDYTNTFSALSEQQNPLNPSHTGAKEWHAAWQARILRQPISLQVASELMCRKNPVLIPRNHQVDKALANAVEMNDLSWFKRCLKAYQNPYKRVAEFADLTQLPAAQEVVHETFCGT